ncbi:glycoside hydrolase family 16 protein [Suillus discolor]|uniref:Glycoside hydrolase family 16 protein n=1 Tax=Suillus discolor TaxID=1912936 RepID=A0A9P7FDI8_9AGAM|nr:glycoside hydrolase family 16 protein [Suillus discolor]KAG2112961.1 glycoside hydrolase family 16 protein [Suillus discolor]
MEYCPKQRVCLAMLPLTILVGARQYSPSRYSRTTAYSVKDYYQGNDFFDDWDFYTGSDPTGGNVIYQSKSDAQSKGLAYVNGDSDNDNGNDNDKGDTDSYSSSSSSSSSIVLAIDSTSTVAAGGDRDAVRITSQTSYSGGLFVLDASQMPVGCSVWPSFWTVGPNWPYGGEIDIVEGINNQAQNQMTVHSGTNYSCTIDTNDSDEYTGSVLASNCYSTESSDAGCSIMDSSSTSFADGFNNAGGGVFALLWDNSVGLSIWHFARSDIPADLTSQAPTPSNWGTPSGFWSAQTCDIADNFYEHQMVIDTTICGNWAAGAYSQSGCSGTCTDMVADASNYVDAKWVINYVAVYQ